MTTQLSRNVRRWLAAGAVALVAGAGYFAWGLLAPSEDTDDAQVSGHVSPVAARVTGTVAAIEVTDNQPVKAGDVLVRIDARDYELAVAYAAAQLSAADAALRAARHDVPIVSGTARSDQQVADVAAENATAGLRAAEREVEAAQAKLESARARRVESQAHATRAARDLERLAPLAEKDEIPRRQFDEATAASAAATAAVQSADAAVREAEANVQLAEARRVQAAGAIGQAESMARAAATVPQQVASIQARAAGADAQVQLARAALERARLDLERTIVRAPADGVVSRRTVEVGQVVSAGQPLMSVTSLHDVWVTANFKETQLAAMHVGQQADVSVDAFGGRHYTGRVESIAAATGATFSLLPPDNATGNFVKVVQRIPVRIVLDPQTDAGQVLRPGMSVVATVYVD